MRPSRTLAPLALVLGVTSLACGALQDDDVGAQQLEHREGDPTYATYPWLWADDTEEEFKAIAAGDMSHYGPRHLGLDHPMTQRPQRLQFWVDAGGASTTLAT